ncbi:unnamed protein product [Rhizopus stolonifer]
MNDTLSFSYDIENYGYPVPIVPNSTEPDSQCKTVNCIYALINDRKKDLQERQQLLDEINKLHKDQEEVQNSLLNHKKEYAIQGKKVTELDSKLK